MCGVTPDGADSRLETTLTGPGELRFWWKVSSEPGKDRLRLYFDGTEQFQQLVISRAISGLRIE